MILELLAVYNAYCAERDALENFRKTCQWWVSGRTPDGKEQHYLLRANREPNRAR
jgi:hypothetical protein